MSAEPHPVPNPALTSRCQGLAVLALGLASWTFVMSRGETPARSTSSHSLRVDPNTAPEGVLEALPRIGPVMAGRIIEAREASPFVNSDDLDRRVKGVGPATLNGLRPYLRFDSKPDDAATSPDR